MAIGNRKKGFLERWLNMGQFPGSELGERETGFRHRNYYHKHFQGYTEVRRVNERGRVVTERHYTAPWQIHQLTDKQWALTKAAYIAGTVLTTVLFLGALTQRVPSNSAPLVAAPGFLSIVMLLLFWMSVFAYVSAPRRMTLWEYRSGKRKIEIFTRLAVAAVLLTALAKVVFLCIWPDADWRGELAGLLMLLASAAPPVCIYLSERRMKYGELENETVVSEEERYDIQ